MAGTHQFMRRAEPHERNRHNISYQTAQQPVCCYRKHRSRTTIDPHGDMFPSISQWEVNRCGGFLMANSSESVWRPTKFVWRQQAWFVISGKSAWTQWSGLTDREQLYSIWARLISASDVTPKYHWLNVWWIWHAKLETLPNWLNSKGFLGKMHDKSIL